MTNRLRIDGIDHDVSAMSPAAQAQVQSIRFVDERLKELINMQALLTRAKRSYIDGLEREIIKSRAGVDLSNLISD
jgi:hypothetical protein